MQLVEAELAATMPRAPAGPPLAASPLGPSGLSPARLKKKRSSAKLYLLIAAGGGMVLVALVIALGLVVFADRRQAARQASMSGPPPLFAQSWPPSGTPGMPAASTLPVAGGQTIPAGGTQPATIASAAGGVWEPDPAILQQLAPEESFDKYAWRPPIGFIPMAIPQPPAPPGAQSQAWAWAKLDPQNPASLGMLTVTVVDSPQMADAGAVQLDWALAGFIHAFKQTSGVEECTFAPGEKGQLAGRQAVRSRFSGKLLGGPLVHGIVLLSVEGTRLVSLSTMSSESPGTPLYQQIEVALLTWRER